MMLVWVGCFDVCFSQEWPNLVCYFMGEKDTQAARVKIEPTLSLPLEKVPRLGQVAYAAVPRRHQSFQNVPTKVRLTAGMHCLFL